MLTLNSKWLALSAGVALCATAALAQDNTALIDTLIKKGILTTDEAVQIQAEAAASKKAAAATPVVSPSKTIVGGKLYVDVSSIDAETANGTKVSPSGVGLDVKRFYFGVTHVFNDVWSANINTDSAYSAATGATSLFIKTAYVQAKLSPLAIIQAGSANQPWIPFDEDTYGFRYVENTLIDRLHVGNSADWGVHLLGSSGMLSYNVAAVNGGGYKNPTRSKSMDLEGRVSLTPVEGLTLAVGAYSGKLGKDTYTTPATRTTTRYDALVAYKTKQFNVGAEYFTENDWGFTGSAQSDKGDGYSVWGQAALSGPFSVFARYDDAKTSKTLHPNMEEQYFNGGFQYHVMSGIDLALVYKHDHVANPASASTVTKYDEIGVFSQVAF
ncbi:MAG TPA: hypothetical protein VHE61_06175 [Opitutaceae bacterium]|nr:hypothetical protein [Opitutaceae bacterium]